MQNVYKIFYLYKKLYITWILLKIIKITKSNFKIYFKLYKANYFKLFRIYEAQWLIYFVEVQYLMSPTVPHFTWIHARNSRKVKLTNPILTDHVFIFWEREFSTIFRNYGWTSKVGFLYSPGYMRILNNCSLICLIPCKILKKLKAIPISNYEGTRMFENKI